MFKTICKQCGKEFEGYTEKQIQYQLEVHTLSKHKEMK